MEKLMQEIEAYACELGLKPTTVVQKSGIGSGITWAKWQNGGSCSMRTADRIRKYMADNPPKSDSEAA